MEHRCFACRMTFPIEPAQRKAEYTWCAEPGCTLRFWHGGSGSGEGNPTKIGIHPDDAPQHVQDALRAQTPSRADVGAVLMDEASERPCPRSLNTAVSTFAAELAAANEKGVNHTTEPDLKAAARELMPMLAAFVRSAP